MSVGRSHRSPAGAGVDPRLPRNLADLSSGASADVVGLDPSAPAEIALRLRHLGFRPGTRVTKARTAPLGDPAVYRLLGYETCLRRHEAAYIEVVEEQ